MAQKPSITIVGVGRLGRTLAEALAKSGYRLREIVFRDASGSKKRIGNLSQKLRARAIAWKKAQLNSDLIWLCVPDAQIETVARNLASRTAWENKIAFHCSGALTSDVLSALRDQGASAASVHPLMTFVHGANPPLQGVPFGLEGDRKALQVAQRIVRDLKGDAFLLKKQDKVLYHAWATMLSPLVLSFVTTAEQVARATGIPAQSTRQKMIPIVTQTLSNFARQGPQKSFSGPLVRGDTAVVAAHLQALKKIPEAREVYIALAKAALQNLTVRNRRKLEELLK